MPIPSRFARLAWFVALLLATGLVPSASAQETTPEAPPPTWISPTPDETGAITVVVQPDESLWIIAARAGLTLPDLLALNNLTEDDVIRPGDVIIIGYGTPPPTLVSPEQLTPTTTPPPPTLRPTQPPPEAAICLSAFEDSNQNGIRDEGETATAGVAFTVYNRDAVVANVITDGRAEPHCLSDLAPGEYYVTRSILPGEVLTTDGDWALVLADDSTLFQSFGSVRAAGTPGAGTAAAGASLATPDPAATSPAAADSIASSVAGAETEGEVSEPAAAQTDWLLWGGTGLLFLGGLLLLTAVLILLNRRSRAG